jgi:hypothetical protein
MLLTFGVIDLGGLCFRRGLGDFIEKATRRFEMRGDARRCWTGCRVTQRGEQAPLVRGFGDRGRSAARMATRDAANLLIAVNASALAKNVPDVITSSRKLKAVSYISEFRTRLEHSNG